MVLAPVVLWGRGGDSSSLRCVIVWGPSWMRFAFVVEDPTCLGFNTPRTTLDLVGLGKQLAPLLDMFELAVAEGALEVFRFQLPVYHFDGTLGTLEDCL